MGIFTAVREGNEQEVIRRLDADPTLVETADADGITVLARAAQQNQLGIVKLLVQRGANINPTGVFEMTALDLAAQEGHEEIVAFLLSKVAQANSKDDEGIDALILASGGGHLAVVRLLVQHLRAQELDGEDDEGCTALHCAADEGHCEVVAFLLSKGAQASTRNTLNETPLISASGCGHIEVLRLLLQHMGPQALKDIDEDGWTALLNAAYWGQDEVLRFLLLAGSDHTITDKEGATARALAEGECIQEEEFHDEEEDDDEEHKEGKVRCVAVLEVKSNHMPTFPGISFCSP
jgi:ankyrin repeat protein